MDSLLGLKETKIHINSTSKIQTLLYITDSFLAPKETKIYTNSFCIIQTLYCSVTDSSLGPKETKIHLNSTSIIRHLSIMEKSLGPKETKIHINSTSIIRTPLYYEQFTWTERDQNSYKLYLYNTDTSLLRTVHLVRKRPNFI